MTHDTDLRIALKNKYLQKHYVDPESKVVDEFGIFWGRSRIDIAVINGHLWGYEIKSEADNLNRLEGQLEDYNQVFDYLTIVIHEKHLSELKNLEERMQSWGIIVASGDENTTKLRIVKKGTLNRDVNSLSIAHLLWKKEAQTLLSKHRIAFSSKLTREELYSCISTNLPTRIIKAEVRQIIKSRTDWRVD